MEQDENGVWCGDYMEIQGGQIKELEGFSGDDCHVEFSVQHDGQSESIRITFNTRAD